MKQALFFGKLIHRIMVLTPKTKNAIRRLFTSCQAHKIDENCILQLTEERAAHIANIYDETNWDSLLGDEKDDYLILPDYFTFRGPVLREEWYQHIGEYIYVADTNDMPWDIDSAKSFECGVSIITCMDALRESAAAFLTDNKPTCRERLSLAISLMTRNGMDISKVMENYETELFKLITHDIRHVEIARQ